MTYTEKLFEAVKSADSCLCVGLDPNLDLLPASVKKQAIDPCRQVAIFLQDVIEATQDHCAAYKPNLGFFEALGAEGLKVFRDVLNRIPSDKIIVADAKRGDISSTARHYATAYFQTFNVDAITLNPLMGFETLEPFLDFPDKGIYTLTLTSNPGARDFLLQPMAGHSTMAEFIAEGLSELENTHATHLGMVVGATQPRQITTVIRCHKTASLLIPGIGKQGGSVTELTDALQGHEGIPLINSSRSIIYAGSDSSDWKKAIAKKARSYQQDLKPITQYYV
jgi:orotidine-5'-phosphate decarboxylase